MQNQAVIYKAASLDARAGGADRSEHASKDGTVALGPTAFSEDGKYMAYAISAAGSDWQEWRVRDVATGKDLPDLIKWSKFSGASWLKDGSGFYYSRYDAPKDGNLLQAVNKNQKVYFHTVGHAAGAGRARLRAARQAGLGVRRRGDRRRAVPARLPDRRHRQPEPRLPARPEEAARAHRAVPERVRRGLHGRRQRRRHRSTC